MIKLGRADIAVGRLAPLENTPESYIQHYRIKHARDAALNAILMLAIGRALDGGVE
jgi:hypothetical protein